MQTKKLPKYLFQCISFLIKLLEFLPGFASYRERERNEKQTGKVVALRRRVYGFSKIVSMVGDSLVRDSLVLEDSSELSSKKSHSDSNVWLFSACCNPERRPIERLQSIVSIIDLLKRRVTGRINCFSWWDSCDEFLTMMRWDSVNEILAMRESWSHWDSYDEVLFSIRWCKSELCTQIIRKDQHNEAIVMGNYLRLFTSNQKVIERINRPQVWPHDMWTCGLVFGTSGSGASWHSNS